MRTTEPLRFGRMYYRDISGNGSDFGPAIQNPYTLAFSRILYGREVLVAYNVSDEERNDYVIIDSSYHKKDEQLHCLYGGLQDVVVNETANGIRYVFL